MKSFSRLAFAAIPPIRPLAASSTLPLASRAFLQPALISRQLSHKASLRQESPDSVKSFMKQTLGTGQNLNAPPSRRTTNDEFFQMPENIAAQNYQTPSYGALGAHIPAAPAKIGPTAGRTVDVTKAGGLQSALFRLGMILRSNHVKSDLRAQKFHERPGLKRKRLKSQRHRKRFAKAFQRMVGTILEMKGKGY